MRDTDRKRRANISPLLVCLSLIVALVSLGLVALNLSITSLKGDSALTAASLSSLKNEDNATILALKDELSVVKANYDVLAATVQAASTDIADIKNEKVEVSATVSDPVFTVSSFVLNCEDDSDQGSAHFDYQGLGAISTAETGDSFVVLVKKTLVSGGASDTPKVEYLPIWVVDGTGQFETDDYVDAKTLKPVYEFQITGYAPMTMVADSK